MRRWARRAKCGLRSVGCCGPLLAKFRWGSFPAQGNDRISPQKARGYLHQGASQCARRELSGWVDVDCGSLADLELGELDHAK